jgi:uncharacterized protein (TIGR02246 family)
VSDRDEIADLLARYALACDERDFDVFRECFTEDAEASFAGERLPPGREHIVDHIRPLVNVPMTQHVVGILSITIHGDIATATSYTTVRAVRRDASGGHELLHRGLRYDDQLVRAPDGWRFRERVHQVLWHTSQPIDWPQ